MSVLDAASTEDWEALLRLAHAGPHLNPPWMGRLSSVPLSLFVSLIPPPFREIASQLQCYDDITVTMVWRVNAAFVDGCSVTPGLPTGLTSVNIFTPPLNRGGGALDTSGLDVRERFLGSWTIPERDLLLDSADQSCGVEIWEPGYTGGNVQEKNSFGLLLGAPFVQAASLWGSTGLWSEGASFEVESGHPGGGTGAP